MPLTRNVDLRNLNRVKRTTTNLDPITYNDRYPGLDEYNYNKLSSKIDMLGLSGYDREKAMDEAYTQVLPLVQNDIKNSDRRKYINQSKYEVSQIQDPTQQKQANMKLSIVELTQLVKEKYNVDPSANDEAVFNSWMETIPNGEQLLVKYLNNGDKELLYKGGLEEKPQKQLDGNFWKNAWANMKSEARGPLDALEKFTYKGIKNIQNLGLKLDDYLAGVAPQSWKDDVMGDMSLEEYRARNKDYRETNKQEIGNYIDLVNTETSNYRDRNVNTQIDDYYDSKNYTDLLREGDWDGFFYKGLGDGASNRDMPVIIGASIVNPAMGTALMGTTSYVRESEEAYENMRRAGATHEEAEVGGAVVGMINAAIEVYLDKLLGGVETSSSKAIRNSLKGNVSQIIGRQSIPNILAHATGVYTRSSLEEGLEEWLQNIVSNAAEMTVKENPEWKDLFKGGRAAAEGGIFNPLNIIAPGGDIAQNTDISAVKQSLSEDAYNAGITARNVVDFAKGPWKSTQEFFLKRADKKIQNINRMTKGQQEKFVKMTGEDQGEFQNKRGYKTIDDMSEALINNLDQVDNAMESIEGRFKSKELDDVVNDTLKYAMETEDPKLQRLQELFNKNKEGGLEMDEINEVKRFYERTNIFDYLKSQQSKKARKSTNRDTKLREWQYKIAEENGLDNLKDLNKETQALKFLVDNASGWQSGIKGNNDISLTDWIIAAGGGLSPQSIASLVGKQVYQSKWFQNKLVDIYNYLGGREYEAGPQVNMNSIEEANTTKREQAKQDAINKALMAAELSKVKNEQEFNAWLKRAELLTQALPYYDNYNGQPTTTIVTNENGQSIRSGRGEITDTNLENQDSYLQEGENSYNDTTNLTPTNEEMTKSTVSKKQQYLDDPWYEQAQTEWYDNWRHDLQNGEERWTDYSDESNQKTEEEHLEWVRNKVRDTLKSTYGRDMTDEQIDGEVVRMEDNWNNLGEDDKLKIVEEYKKATADWSPAGEGDENYEEGEEYDDSLHDYGWIDPNLSADELEMQGIPVEKLREQEAREKEKVTTQALNNNVISNLNEDMKKMKKGQEIRVTEMVDGDKEVFTIKRLDDGFHIYQDGMINFIGDDEIGPNGLFSTLNIVSYTKPRRYKLK